MKLRILLVLFAVTSQAFAARLDVDSKRPMEAITSERKANVLIQARRVFSLPDGSLWVTHPVPAEREPSALGVTRFSADGSARVFLLTDWMRKGEVRHGWCGQVYGVALLDDGHLAVSGGWTDGSNSHNAIFVLKPRADGGYDTINRFDVPGVAELVAAAPDRIFAITNDPSRAGGGALLTLYNQEGVAISGYAPENRNTSVLEAAQNARNSRVVRISRYRFAIYNAFDRTVDVLDVKPETARGAVFAPFSKIFIDGDATIANLPVIGIAATQKEVLVVRSGNVRGHFGTLFTAYNSLADVTAESFLDRPWNFVFPENGKLRGVVHYKDAMLDTIEFQGD